MSKCSVATTITPGYEDIAYFCPNVKKVYGSIQNHVECVKSNIIMFNVQLPLGLNSNLRNSCTRTIFKFRQ